jgi:hypothetical protein
MTASGGHSRHSDYVDDRSAMPELRTSASAAGMSQLGHEPTLARLFDHLVGAGEQHRRNGQAERSGGDKVYHQIKLSRLLDRQVSGLRPAQNLVDKVGSAPVWSGKFGP